MSHPHPLPLHALILSQFHHKKGFQIIESIPPQIISPTQFTIYSQLILFREELCNRLLVTQFLDQYYVVGIPLLSVNGSEKAVYERAKYLYAVSFVVLRGDYLGAGARYREVLGKLAGFFKFVEELSNIIYYNLVPENREYLKNQLKKAYTHINNGQQCVLSHFSSYYTILNLNHPPFPRHLPQAPPSALNCPNPHLHLHLHPHPLIQKSSVPVTFLLDRQIEEIQSEFGKKLLRFAKTGDYNIRKICELVEVQDQRTVYRYFGKAMEMGVVFMFDMFYLDNRYCLTEHIHRYTGERSRKYQQQLQSICQQVSLKRSQTSSQTSSEPAIPITPNILLYLYFQLSRKTTLKKIIDDNIQLFTNINILKWIRISQIHGLIRRIYCKFAVEETGLEDEAGDWYISEEKLAGWIGSKGGRGYGAVGSGGVGDAGWKGYGGTIREQYERINSLFNIHLRNMDTIDEICVSLKVSKAVLLNLLDYSNQKKLRIFYVNQ